MVDPSEWHFIKGQMRITIIWVMDNSNSGSGSSEWQMSKTEAWVTNESSSASFEFMWMINANEVIR